MTTTFTIIVVLLAIIVVNLAIIVVNLKKRNERLSDRNLDLYQRLWIHECEDSHTDISNLSSRISQ